MFCCCNHNKQRSPCCSSFLKIKFFSPHEGLNEAFIYATTIKLTMAPIQFSAPCEARKHAELIFLIQNTNDKTFIGQVWARDLSPKTLRCLVFIYFANMDLEQFNKQRQHFYFLEP